MKHHAQALSSAVFSGALNHFRIPFPPRVIQNERNIYDVYFISFAFILPRKKKIMSRDTADGTPHVKVTAGEVFPLIFLFN